MGIVEGVTPFEYPMQSSWVGQRVEVCFRYDTARKVGGTIVRDDKTPPGETIIRLDDGFYVRAGECQYSLPHRPDVASAYRNGYEAGYREGWRGRRKTFPDGAPEWDGVKIPDGFLGNDPETARQWLEALIPASDSWQGWPQLCAQLDHYAKLCYEKGKSDA